MHPESAVICYVSLLTFRTIYKKIKWVQLTGEDLWYRLIKDTNNKKHGILNKLN